MRVGINNNSIKYKMRTCSRVSIRDTKIFGQVGGRDRPRKNLLTSSLITVQNLVFHTVCAHGGGTNIWGRGPRLLRWTIGYRDGHDFIQARGTSPGQTTCLRRTPSTDPLGSTIFTSIESELPGDLVRRKGHMPWMLFLQDGGGKI